VQYLTHFWKYQVIVTLIIWHMAYGIIDFISQQQIVQIMNFLTDVILSNILKLFISWIIWLTRFVQIIQIMNYSGRQTDRSVDGQTYGWRSDRIVYYQQTDRRAGWQTDRWCHSFLKIDTFLPPKKDSWHLSSAKKSFFPF